MPLTDCVSGQSDHGEGTNSWYNVDFRAKST